jgi:glucokinase
MNRDLLGFDIGGTKCAVVLGRSESDCIDIVEKSTFSTLLGPEPTLAALEKRAQELLVKHQIGIKAIGISCGGPLDSRRGLILSPPNLLGWDRVPVAEVFGRAFNVPVRLQNDANACALAEWKWGAGRGSQNMIFLTFGTGLGAGLILDGKLYVGVSDAAGEVGHIRLAEDGPVGFGKRGSFEGFCSGGGIARLARIVVEEHWQRGQRVAFCRDAEALENLSAQRVFEAARHGDVVAVKIVQICAKQLGRGLAILIDILNPQRIVIGSIFARQHDQLWPLAKSILQKEALDSSLAACQIVPAELGESIGDYAALATALQL